MISDERIMGFVEGEGCFSIGIQKNIDRKPRKTGRKNNWKTPSTGLKVSPNFRITQVKEDNEILHKIQDRFGFGLIYHQKRTGNAKDISQYCVQTLDEIIRLVEFFKDK